MAQGHQTRSYLGAYSAVNVVANTSKQEVCRFGINTDMRLNLKVDVVLGQCSVAGTTTLGIQDSNGLGLWNDTKTGAVSSSTDKTISSVTANTGTLTSNGHGYANDQLITINSSGTVPGGLVPGGKYYVANKTTNTFQLATSPGGVAIASFTDAGTGTIKTSACTVVTLVFNAQTAGDVQYLPLRPNGRVVCTTDTLDTVQVVDVRVAHLY